MRIGKGYEIPYPYHVKFLATTAAVSAVIIVAAATTIRVAIAYKLTVTAPRVACDICRRWAWTHCVDDILALLLEQCAHLVLSTLVTESLNFTLLLTVLDASKTVIHRLHKVACLTLGFISDRREATFHADIYAVDGIGDGVGLVAKLQRDVATEVGDLLAEVAAAVTKS